MFNGLFNGLAKGMPSAGAGAVSAGACAVSAGAIGVPNIASAVQKMLEIARTPTSGGSSSNAQVDEYVGLLFPHFNNSRPKRKAAIHTRQEVDLQTATQSRRNTEGFVELRVGYTNIRGNMTHPDLRGMVSNFDIFAVAETFLNESTVLPHIEGYTLHRRDRTGHGGGVAIYIRDTVAHNNNIRLSVDVSNVEQLWLSVHIESEVIHFGVLYNPPPYVARNLESWWRNIERFENEGERVVCVGDFNLNQGDATNSAVQTFNERLQETGYTQLVRDNTRVWRHADGYRRSERGTLIDYVVTNVEEFIQDVLTDDPIGKSDHKVIIFHVRVKKDKKKQ